MLRCPSQRQHWKDPTLLSRLHAGQITGDHIYNMHLPARKRLSGDKGTSTVRFPVALLLGESRGQVAPQTVNISLKNEG